MRWNPFRRASVADAADSSFETTVVDDLAAARLGAQHASVALAAASARPGGPASLAAGSTSTATMMPATTTAAHNLADSESIGHVGRYALKTVLGKGGLGTVYSAWDPLLSRAIALKTLHLDADPAERNALDALFLNEARAAAGLSHPHIVTVFDAGPSDNGVYIAMERLQGQDLRHLLQQGVRPGPVEAAQVVRRVADALAYAHRKGVVHCDVKPANIFMTGRMHPKVLDFGIARVAHRDVPALEGALAGSPYYLAPEQIDGRSVDRRSDVYSLGVVLYELLVGRKPFEGKSLEEIIHAVKTAEVAPAHRASTRVPLGLSIIASRAMERDPDQRYPSARHLSMELRHWIDSTEARALRTDTRGSSSHRKTARALRIARVAGPLGALAIAGALWWAKTLPPADARAAVADATPVAPMTRPAARPTTAVARPAQAAASITADPAASPGPALLVAGSAKAADASAASAAVVTAGASTPTRADKLAAAKADAARKHKSAASGAGDTVLASALTAQGVVQLAVSPWGQIEVDGRAMGTSPPLTHLTLSSGPHTITVRNTDFPPYTSTLTVGGENPVTLRHRFGP